MAVWYVFEAMTSLILVWFRVPASSIACQARANGHIESLGAEANLHGLAGRGEGILRVQKTREGIDIGCFGLLQQRGEVLHIQWKALRRHNFDVLFLEFLLRH